MADEKDKTAQSSAPKTTTPTWLTDLLAILEAILQAIPTIDGAVPAHSQLSRADIQQKIDTLKGQL